MIVYVCPKCKKASHPAGGRPVCCYCGKTATRTGDHYRDVRTDPVETDGRIVEPSDSPTPAPK